MSVNQIIGEQRSPHADEVLEMLYTIHWRHAKPTIDFRPRIQIRTQINKFNFLAGYSLGLTNYQSKFNYKAYTSFVYLGLGYQLK